MERPTFEKLPWELQAEIISYVLDLRVSFVFHYGWDPDIPSFNYPDHWPEPTTRVAKGLESLATSSNIYPNCDSLQDGTATTGRPRPGEDFTRRQLGSSYMMYKISPIPLSLRLVSKKFAEGVNSVDIVECRHIHNFLKKYLSGDQDGLWFKNFSSAPNDPAARAFFSEARYIFDQDAFATSNALVKIPTWVQSLISHIHFSIRHVQIAEESCWYPAATQFGERISSITNQLLLLPKLTRLALTYTMHPSDEDLDEVTEFKEFDCPAVEAFAMLRLGGIKVLEIHRRYPKDNRPVDGGNFVNWSLFGVHENDKEARDGLEVRNIPDDDFSAGGIYVSYRDREISHCVRYSVFEIRETN